MISRSDPHVAVSTVSSMWMLLWLLVGCAGRPARAAEEPARTAAQAAGQVMVKFQPEAAASMQQALRAGTFPAMGIGSLEALFAQFGLQACEPLFPVLPDQTQDAVGLNRIYLCTLDSGTDLAAAIQAFSQDPNVEYAEPNYVATLHSGIDTPPSAE